MNYVDLSADPNLAPFATSGSTTNPVPNNASTTGASTSTASTTSPSATAKTGGAASLKLPVGLGAVGAVAWAVLCLL